MHGLAKLRPLRRVNVQVNQARQQILPCGEDHQTVGPGRLVFRFAVAVGAGPARRRYATPIVHLHQGVREDLDRAANRRVDQGAADDKIAHDWPQGSVARNMVVPHFTACRGVCKNYLFAGGATRQLTFALRVKRGGPGDNK